MTATLLHPTPTHSLQRAWTLLLTLVLLGGFSLKARAQTGNVCTTPIEIASLPFDDAGNTSAYGNDYANADVPPTATGAVTTGTGSDYYLTGSDVVYAFTPTYNGAISISTTNADDWVGLWVFTGCPFASTVGYHTSISGATRSIAGLPVNQGTTYYIVISSWESQLASTDYTLHVELDWSAEPCTETPDPGATTGPSDICPGVEFVLGIQNTTNNNGISYQWETSADGTTWADAPGNSTGPTYTATQTGDTWYRCQVSCDVAGTGTSTPLQVPTNDPMECYCIPNGGGNNTDEILNFTLANLDHSSASGEGVAGYSDYTGSVPPALMVIGTSYTATLTSGNGTGNHGAAIWIDYNDNGLFEPAEKVASIGLGITPNTVASFPSFTAANAPGTHRLRVQYTYNQAGEALDPCNVTTIFSETEDYLVQLFEPADCDATPDPGPTTGPAHICPDVSFTLGITNNTTESGISYQWETSTDGTNWADAPGNSTGASYNTSQNVDTWYRCRMSCDAAGTGTSTSLQVLTDPATECYCTPTGSTNNTDEIVNFTLADLNNNSAPSEGILGYSDYTGSVAPAHLVAGTSYIASLTSGTGSGNHGAAIWIDYNDNGVFEPAEKVASIGLSIPGGNTVNFPAFVASDAPGVHRLRVQYAYSLDGGALNPCTITTSFSETEDYLVEIAPAEPEPDCLGELGGPALPGTPCVSDNGYGGLWSNDCICIENVGIGEITAADRLALHPNPASTILYLTTPGAMPMHVKVHDMLGQLVLEQGRATQIDIRNLVPGSYLLQVLDDQGMVKATARFVKQ